MRIKDNQRQLKERVVADPNFSSSCTINVKNELLLGYSFRNQP